MIEAKANPKDYESVPWVDHCERCKQLHAEAAPEREGVTWAVMTAIAIHFENDHAIALVQG